MRELELVKTGRLTWRDTAEPALRGTGDALVRAIAVARCDLDAAILRGEAPFRGRALHFLRDHLPQAIGQRRLFRNAPFKGPYAFGHECVAEVLAVADDVLRVRPGDRVVVPFQISCGRCRFCERGLTGSCDGVRARSMYGFGSLGGKDWGGVLADVTRVPFADAMLVPLPGGVDPVQVASAGDNIADGYRTVAGPLARAPRAPVLVMGGGAASVGLYAAGVAVALGAERVCYVDRDATRLRVAEALGAHALEAPYASVRERFPITVDASADPDGLRAALLSTEPGGTCTSVGIYYSDVKVPMLQMYGNGITFVTGRVHARAVLPAVLDLVVSGALRPELVTSRVGEWRDAPEAMLDPGPKVVVSRPALRAAA